MTADTFTPPQGVQAEARRALRWMADGEAGQNFTAVGRRRASQLANGDPVSERTLRRMRSYLARHSVDAQGEGYSPGEPGYPSPGRVAWAAWGGDAGRSWAEGVLRGLDAREKSAEKPDRAQALRVARMMGCEGAHQDEAGNWLPCKTSDEMAALSTEAEPKAAKGRRRRGKQWEKLRERPVSGINTLPGGGLVAAPMASKSAQRHMRRARRDRLAATPAPMRDRVVGSDRNSVGSAGSVSSGTDIVLTEAVRQALTTKVKEHNDSLDGGKNWQRASEGAVQSVYRRGAGAYSGSHRPGMTRGQWAMGRVNAFLKMLKSGKPDNARYVGDNDLLPRDHPWKKPKT